MIKSKRKIYKIKLTIYITFIVSFFIFVLSIFVLYNLYKRLDKSIFIYNHKKQLELKLDKLKEQEKSIKNNIEFAKSQYGIEKRIREEFNKGLEGENIFIIIKDDKKNEDIKKKETILDKIKNIFMIW